MPAHVAIAEIEGRPHDQNLSRRVRRHQDWELCMKCKSSTSVGVPSDRSVLLNANCRSERADVECPRQSSNNNSATKRLAELSDPAMASQASSGIRILLVDDHVVVRAGIRMIIQSRPEMAIAGEAGTRDEALAIAASEQPDIILLDLDLGGDSGMDVLSALRETSSEARIIVLTGLRDPAVHRRAVLLGAMGIVSKEKAAEVLINAIERVHAGEAWLDPSLVAGVLGEVSRAGKTKKADPEETKITSLTNRERQVVVLIGEGIKNKEIADRLFISETTVRHHLTSIFSKLELADRVELLIYAFRHGLAKPPR